MVIQLKTKRLADKKKKLDKSGPLPPELARNLEEWLRVELTYTSNALEGNTLTRRETALVVEKGITVGGKSLVEHLEATNHAHALDWIRDQALHPISHFKESELLRLHERILQGIGSGHAGFYRSVPVRLAGSRTVLPNPRKVSDLMDEFHQWMQGAPDLHPVDFAAEAHYRLVTIHPFVDGNGRTARLLMNLILLHFGYPLAIIRKRERGVYLDALEKAQTGGSSQDYLQIIYKAVNRSLDLYLKAVQGGSDFPIEPDDSLLRIGQLAKETKQNVSTIRFWVKEGLLEVSELTPSGYQLFATDMIHRAEQIRKLKEERYTLREIKDRLP